MYAYIFITAKSVICKLNKTKFILNIFFQFQYDGTFEDYLEMFIQEYNKSKLTVQTLK